MRIALINPGRFNIETPSTTPPFGLLYIAAYLRKNIKNLEIRLFDSLVGQDFKQNLIKFEPDIVAITGTTQHISEGYKIADFCRTLKKRPLIVMGGRHVSSMTDEALQHCDVVVKGEGEKAILEIVKNFRGNKKIDKIIERPFINNLDDLPIPAYDLADMENYINAEEKDLASELWKLPNVRVGWLITSRGCPFRCIFCYNSWCNSPVRYHSAERVIEEIEYLKKKYNIQALWFFDDEFLMNKPRVIKICEYLRKIKMPWSCQARSTTLGDKDLIRIIKDSGCVSVSVGFESGNQRILGLLKNRTIKIEDNIAAIENCKEIGLGIGGNFMFGTPSETLGEMRDTFNFALKYFDDLLFCYFCIATPYPGTTLWKMCKERNLIPTKKDYNTFDIGYSLVNLGRESFICCDTMSKEEFKKYFKEWNRITGERAFFKEKHEINKLIKKAIKKPFLTIRLFIKNPFFMFKKFKQSLRKK